MRLGAALLLIALAGCKKKDESPVCGLHSASAPVILIEDGNKERTLGVGAKLSPSDRIKSKGDALLECFGGALKRLEKGDKTEVGDLIESKIESTNVPRKRIVEGKVVAVDSMPPTMAPRYTTNRFTPETALPTGGEDKTNYLMAFFTPNGIENLTSGGPPPDGPRELPPPPARAKVPFVHAGELGQGGPTLDVTDEVVFVETDDLATAALPEGKKYALGRVVRVVIPDGAEATLIIGEQRIELDGPIDLRLR